MRRILVWLAFRATFPTLLHKHCAPSRPPADFPTVRRSQHRQSVRVVFFADIGLLAPRRCAILFRATIVGMAFLDFGGDGTAASAAAKKPPVRFP